MHWIGLLIPATLVIGLITEVFLRPRIDFAKDKILLWYDGAEGGREFYILYEKKC